MRMRATALVCAFEVHEGVSRLRGVPLLLVGPARSARLVTNAEAATPASGRAEECFMLAVATTEFVTVLQSCTGFLLLIWIHM